MYFKPGDLVVSKYSKAAILKNKIFRVIARIPKNHGEYYEKYQVINAFGKQKEMDGYSIHSLQDEEALLQRQVNQAEQEATRRRNALYMLQQELKQTVGYFPRI